MCGRFTLRTPASVLIEMFGLGTFGLGGDADEPALPLFEPRYNIAPTQSIWAVRESTVTEPAAAASTTTGSSREAVQLHWGLIPSWAKDVVIGNRMINARAESVAEKPAYRHAFRKQRCLILTDGYYEWQKGGTGPKQPYYFHRPDGKPFALAGLWERWEGDPSSPPDRDSSVKKKATSERQQTLFGEEVDEERDANTDAAAADSPKSVIESCTIITTRPNALAATVHDRMPVILHDRDFGTWLDRNEQDAEQLGQLLVPLAEDDFLIAEPVSTFVNKPTNDGPACIEPL